MTKIGISQNGWAVYDDTSKFTRVTVAGVGFWAATPDVAVVLADFTQKYNDTIESIILPVKESPGYDDWSYAVRPVRGQTSGYSNHASATAWDLNSTRHPRGVHGTYSDLKRKGLKALVDSYDGVLRDGEFYQQGTIDGMHIEINASASAVKKVADRIRAKAREDEDMDWNEKHQYSAADAKALGDPSLEGKDYSANVMLRGYTPTMQRLRREALTFQANTAATLAALTAAVTALAGKGGITSAQLEAAAKAGADEALSALADRLDPDETK